MLNVLGHYNPPQNRELEILYEDPALLVLNKPSGLLSVPGRGEHKQDSLATRVQQHYPDALIVHRLDMETSGVIVMARDKQTHRQLSILFQEREVQKRYLAIVDGRIPNPIGEIDLPLITDWPNRPRQIVDREKGKPSRTHYRVLSRDIEADTTRAELTPITGRSHQLRVHLQQLGYPILGDPLYGNGQSEQKAERLLLHACSLSFIHPVTGEPLRFLSNAPF